MIVFHSDPLAHCADVRTDALLIPALRFCGQLARWTGNSTTNQVHNAFHAVGWSASTNYKRQQNHVREMLLFLISHVLELLHTPL